ncbi:MAG: beta-lactamase family protein [Actinomycetota bacterium]|nr:beta-lactamase family protein [Actinomycetota bacterium]
MAGVHGFCDERFTPLRDLFRAGFERGRDEGASLAVTTDGRSVVDLWGGYRDLAHTKPWETDTLVRVASTSKVIVAIATLMVWDRGLIDLDEPVATYWPEFAQGGKAPITTRQVLVHRSGLPGFGRPLTSDDVGDWDRMVALVERAPVWYEPGTITCYHSSTFGYILGELVHRVSGVPFARFVAEEITGPLGADFHYTLTAPRDLARLAEPRPAEGPKLAAAPIGDRVNAEEAPLMGPFHTTELIGAVMPGGTGISNARALARIGSIMAMGGEVDGRRYLKRETVDEAAREQSYTEDQMLGTVRRGLFFGLDSREFPAATPTTIHWGGHGGSWLTMDPASGITCAYAPNRWLVGDEWLIRQAEQWEVLIDVLRSVRR